MLQGKSVLITGAGGGVGAACALRAFQEGARVICTDIDPSSEARIPIPFNENNLFLQHDVSSQTDWRRVESIVQKKYGNLDGLLNNAGIFKKNSIEDTTLEAFHQVMAVNLDGTLLGCQTGIQLMKETGGSIVNIASIAAEKPGPVSIAYGVSKAGIVNMTKSVASYCQKSNFAIRCNAVSPGAVDTEMMLQAFGNRLKEGHAPALQKNVASPEQIAEGVIFLLSDRSSYVTGTTLLMDGGRLL